MADVIERHVYLGHQLTVDMTSDTNTVFLVERETKVCFAYLCRWPGSDRDREWSVWAHNHAQQTDKLVETSRTYEACLMMLGAKSAGRLLTFEVWFSDTRMPGR